MTPRTEVEKLAKDHGCAISVYPNGAVYFDAPRGYEFRTCQSEALVIGGVTFGTSKPNWKDVLEFFKSEISEGLTKRYNSPSSL